MRSAEVETGKVTFPSKLLSRKEAHRRLELERSRAEEGWGRGAGAGRGPESLRLRVVWPWRRLRCPGGWKRRMECIQMLFGKSRASQGQLITQCKVCLSLRCCDTPAPGQGLSPKPAPQLRRNPGAQGGPMALLSQ